MLTPQQALQQLEQAAGRPLTPQEIQQAQAMLPAGWQNGIDPSALAPLLQQAATLRSTGRVDASPTDRQVGVDTPATGPGAATTVTATTPRGSYGHDTRDGEIGRTPPSTVPGAATTVTASTPTGSLLQPWLRPPPDLLGYTPAGAPTWQGPTFDPGAPRSAPQPFAYEAFDPGDPFTFDPQSVLNDPSYLFRKGQGEQAIQQSAAAKGMLRSGNTWKGLIDYGQNFASNEVNNVFGRQRDIYSTNLANKFGAWNANRANAMDAYKTNWGITDDVADANYGMNLDRFNTGMTSATAAFAPQLANWQTQVQQGRKNVDDFNARSYDAWLDEYDQWDKQRKFVYDSIYGQQRLGAGLE